MGLFDAFRNPYGSSVKQAKKGRKHFQQTMETVNPLYESMLGSGQNANTALSDFLGLNGTGAQQSAFNNYNTSPGFQFMLDKSNKALDQGAAANGMLRSGAAQKALADNTLGMYQQDYGNHLSRLSGMLQGGVTGAQGLTNNSLNLANLRMQQGQAQDMNNQGAFSNLMGAVGMGASLLGGYGGGGLGGGLSSMFNTAPRMPTYSSGAVNPWAVY